MTGSSGKARLSEQERARLVRRAKHEGIAEDAYLPHRSGNVDHELKKRDGWMREEDKRECTFQPRTATAASIRAMQDCGYEFARDAGAPPKEGKRDQFVERLTRNERFRRRALEAAIGAAAYKDRLDKKCCPICGTVQSYDEWVERYGKGRNCQECSVPRVRRAGPLTTRGDAALTARGDAARRWIVRGDESRPRRGDGRTKRDRRAARPGTRRSGPRGPRAWTPGSSAKTRRNETAARAGRARRSNGSASSSATWSGGRAGRTPASGPASIFLSCIPGRAPFAPRRSPRENGPRTFGARSAQVGAPDASGKRSGDAYQRALRAKVDAEGGPFLSRLADDVRRRREATARRAETKNAETHSFTPAMPGLKASNKQPAIAPRGTGRSRPREHRRCSCLQRWTAGAVFLT